MFKPILVAALLTALSGGVALAQSPTSSAIPAAEGGKHHLAFRMQNWKTVHMHDAEQAKQHVETLKALGCEVKTAQHDGHIDVQARTTIWKLLALDSQGQVEQWQAWFAQAGFDSLHGHPPLENPAPVAGQAHAEVVQYRSIDWKVAHLPNVQDSSQRTILYRALGCETKSDQHSGHFDVSARCPDWMEIELPNHQAAHAWQDFLNKAGFETKHNH
ncbi:hypothetical protein [Aureliella helgolandensis]|uniref:Uncharacterized protein n=1 Tax=Aureliella helgolandensis TaxID=2527968 RepID=A0A518GAP1_9BACT|nr:hypothetical protein [Aureliella helgolandensis]QDV25633.1 hypothetical protein Q31a_39590 [Aureliella helgolandensis]